MASRFWVGGTGTWDDITTTHWALSSGGAGGASVPTATDDVVFDANSGAGTVSYTSNRSFGSATFTGFTGTLNGAAGTSLLPGGNITCGSAMSLTGTVNFNFGSTAPTSGTKLLTMAGRTLPGILSINGTSVTVSLQDAYSGTQGISHNGGTFLTNGFSVTAQTFTSTSGATRTMSFGSSTVSITGNVTNAFNISGVGLTITVNTATVTFPNAMTATAIVLGSNNLNGMSFSLPAGGTPSLNINNPTIANFSFTGRASKFDSINLSGSLTCTGTFTVTSNSTINRVFVTTNVPGSSRTITAGAVAMSGGVDFQDIVGAGAGSWNLSALSGGSGDVGGNTGITFTPSSPQAWQGTAGGNWSDVTKWTSRVPLPQDDVTVGVAFAAAQTITIDVPRIGRNVTFSSTGSPTLNQIANWALYGSLNITSTVAIGAITSTGFGPTMAGRGSYTITTNGRSFPGAGGALTIGAVGGTYTLLDNLSMGATFNLADGIFDANGFSVSAWSINLQASGRTRQINMGSGTWTASATSGNAWQSTTSGLTVNVGTATLNLSGAGSATIQTGGVTMPSTTFSGTGGTDTLVDAFTTAGTIALSAGTLDTGGFAVTCANFVGASSTARTLTLGASLVTLTGTSITQWNFSQVTNLTITPNTATVNLTGQNGTINAGAINYNGTSFATNGSGGGPTWAGVATIANLSVTRTGSSASMIFSSDVTVTGTVTFTGPSAAQRLIVSSNVLGTQRTITAGAVSLTNVDFTDIVGAGAATWTGTIVGDALGNAGITFTPSQTNYWRGNGGSWSDVNHWASTSGGAAASGRVPLPQDDVRFDANSVTLASQTLTWDTPRQGRSIDFTGFRTGSLTSITPSPANSTIVMYGSLTLSPWITRTAFWTWQFQGRGTHTLMSNGCTMAPSYQIASIGGSYSLLDAMTGSTTAGASLLVQAGTFTSNNFSMTIGTGGLTVQGQIGSTTRTVNLGTSTVTHAPGTIAYQALQIQSTAGLTWNGGSATHFLMASTFARTITPAGVTLGAIDYSVPASPGALTFNGSCTITSLIVGDGRTLTFTPGNTFTIGAWNVNGSLSSPTTVNSSTAGSRAILQKTAGAPAQIYSNYLTIQDIDARTSAGTNVAGAWDAGPNSTNAGNNVGWYFATTVLGATASFAATAAMSADSLVIEPGAASMNATAAMSADSLVTAAGAAAMAAIALMTADSTVVTVGAADMSADASMSASGGVEAFGIVQMAAVAYMQAYAMVTEIAAATFDVHTALTAIGGPFKTGSATMNASGLMTALGIVYRVLLERVAGAWHAHTAKERVAGAWVDRQRLTVRSGGTWR